MNRSKRASLLRKSPIYYLDSLALEAEAIGVDVIRLNLGQPDMAPPAAALEALKEISVPLLRYEHKLGKKELREELAKYYTELGYGVDPEGVVISNGASEAIRFALVACLDQGESLLMPEPFYANMKGFCTENGIEIQPIPATFDNGFELPPISTWEEHIATSTRGIWLVNPGNPTGKLYTKEEIDAVAQIALKHDLYLFTDEVYRGLEFNGKKLYSPMQDPKLDQHAVLVDSFSKRFNLPAARIGCVASKNLDIMEAVGLLATTRLSASSDMQHAALAALKERKEYMKALTAKYSERRTAVQEWMKDLPEGMEAYLGDGAFYLVLKLKDAKSPAFCEWMLEHFRRDNQTVMMTPTTGFYLDESKGEHEIRVTLLQPQERLQRALELVKEGLEEYTTVQVSS